jgi:hypothetical protein
MTARSSGRISAQVDALVQDHMQPGTGQWGMFEALDAEAAAALINCSRIGCATGDGPSA